MIEPIDFLSLDDNIQSFYLDKFHKMYPFNIYENKLKLFNDIIANRINVWAIIDKSELLGLALTLILDNKILDVYLVMKSFSLSERIMKEGFNVLENHAKKNNCKIIQIGGRKGWEKIAKSFGYSFASITMLKSTG